LSESNKGRKKNSFLKHVVGGEVGGSGWGNEGTMIGHVKKRLSKEAEEGGGRQVRSTSD